MNRENTADQAAQKPAGGAAASAVIQPREPGAASKVWDFFIKYNTVIIFIVLIIVASMLSDVFFTEKNMLNLLRQLAALGIISMGMLLVILTGGIDLSVGAFAALGCVVSAVLLADFSFPVAIGLTVLIGLFMGGVSGYLVARRHIAPFVATLAMMTIANGLAFIISKGSPILVENRAMQLFDRGYFFGIPLHVCVMFIVFLITVFLLRSTLFGRMIKAIGSNESAVTLSGVKTDIYKMAVYCIAGGLSAIAGIIISSRTGVGSPLVGTGYELDAIAAVVIGGASLSGGRGTALNTLLGVLILGLISNIMNLMNIPAYPQQVLKGLIIIAAVMFQVVNKKRA